MDELNNKPKKRENLAIHELGDEVMLYDLTNEKIHVLLFLTEIGKMVHTEDEEEEEISSQRPCSLIIRDGCMVFFLEKEI